MSNTLKHAVAGRRRFLWHFGVGSAGLAAACASRAVSGTPEDAEVQTTLSALTGSNIRWANSVQELTDPTHNSSWADAVIVAGYYGTGDGGGGLFVWDASITQSDFGVFFRTGTANGGWRRVFSGAVNVRWYGARADASALDAVAQANSTAIQAAVDSLKLTGGEVFFPAGTYKIWRPISLRQIQLPQNPESMSWYNGVSLVGEGVASCIKAARACLETDAQGACTSTLLGMIHFGGWNCYTLRNVGVRSLRISGFDEATFVHKIVSFANTEGSFAIDCTIDTNQLEGLYWNGTDRNVTVTGNYATRVGNYGGTGSAGWRLSAYNINAFNVTMTRNVAYQVGVGIEHTQAGGTIAHNLFTDCYKTGIMIQSTQWERRLIVRSNVIRETPGAISLNQTLGAVLIADNIIEGCSQGITGKNFDSPVTIRGNILFGARDSTGGAIQRDGSAGNGEQCAPMPRVCAPNPPSSCQTTGGQPGVLHRPNWAVIEDNVIAPGSTSRWGYGVYTPNAKAPAGDVISGNVLLNYAASNPFMAGDTWTDHEYSDNYLRPAPLPPNPQQPTPPDQFPHNYAMYNWIGANYPVSQQAFSGAASGPKIRAVSGSQTEGAYAPSSGRWSVGDLVRNSAPKELGNPGSRYIIRAWACVTGGTPGAWRELRSYLGS